MYEMNRHSQTNSYSKLESLSLNFALEVAREAAHIGGKLVREHFGETARISLKRHLEIQTEVDTEAERAIMAFIEDRFPAHSILGEEGSMRHGYSPYTWIIDPLDGTNNYVLDIPQFAVCVSLKKGDQVLLTAIYQPMSDITYTALREQGVCLNDKQICLQEQHTMLSKSTVCNILAYSVHGNPVTHFVFSEVYKNTRRLLDTWTPSLDWCMLATGKIDALVYLSNESLWHDPGMLAGAFLFEEAGGKIHPLTLRGDDSVINELKEHSIIAARSCSMIDQINALVERIPRIEELVKEL